MSIEQLKAINKLMAENSCNIQELIDRNNSKGGLTMTRAEMLAVVDHAIKQLDIYKSNFYVCKEEFDVVKHSLTGIQIALRAEVEGCKHNYIYHSIPERPGSPDCAKKALGICEYCGDRDHA